MSRKSQSRQAGETVLMTTATTTCSEAADLMARVASRMGPYTRKGQVEIAGSLIGLSPRQSIRLAYREWKTIPAHVMDRLRALYSETCEGLEDGTRQLIEETDAIREKHRRKDSCVDGKCPDAEGGRDDAAEADPRTND